MNGTKKMVIPNVDGVGPVTNWDASVDFITDAISVPLTTREFSIDFQDWAGVTAVLPVFTLLVSNKIDGEYKAYNADSTNADLTVADNRFTFDAISPFLYMKISYTSGASTGTFSIIALV